MLCVDLECPLQQVLQALLAQIPFVDQKFPSTLAAPVWPISLYLDCQQKRRLPMLLPMLHLHTTLFCE
jgi:hypothetical protein